MNDIQLQDPGALAGAREMTDEAVIAGVLRGETALFEILMRRYNQRLYRVARGILRDEVEAEDVVQEAYLSAYTHLGQFANRARFSTWLTKIAVHEALARARRRNRYAEAPEGDDMTSVKSDGPDPEQQAQAAELRSVLEGAIDALPPTYRSVFILRDVEQLSTLEAAECLEVSEDAVKMRLHRARALLRTDLVDRMGTIGQEAYRFDGERCNRIVRSVMARIRGESDRETISRPTNL